MDSEPMDESDEGSFISDIDDDENEEVEWNRFFPFQEGGSQHPAYIAISQFKEFLNNHEILNNIRRKEHCLYIPYSLMIQYLPKSFIELLSNNPEIVFPSMELALYRYYKSAMLSRPDLVFHSSDCLVSPRIIDWPVTGMKHIKAHCVGKFFSVSGTVIRASGIKALVTTMSFKCPRCGVSIPRRLEEGKYVPPAACTTPQCKGKRFEPELDKAVSCDWQQIRIQESVQGFAEAGRMPRMMDVDLLHDLADTCVPGDTVTLVGIIKRQATEKASVQKRTNKMQFTLYMEARGVVNTKQPSGGVPGGADVAEEYDASELLALRKIAQADNVFQNIVNSLCPSIYGHELVKAGLCLALFGGTQQQVTDGGVRVRGDPHVLIVGDPGLGKSQMLRAISTVAPRGVYVCGSYSSASGLTVTLLREPGTGDHILEAGALVLADQGVCCIDEFDKMPNEHHALLEAMEQQNISVAKAGIVCTLNARTSVIAAANPAGGHYDRSKTVAENLKLSPALLSRFDLVFILLDKPDEGIDKRLSEHVMAIHGNIAARAQGQKAKDSPPIGMVVWQSQPPTRGASQYTSSEVGRSLLERLRVTDPSSFLAIPPKALRKYIAYARKYVNPKLSPEASATLQAFYLKIRRDHATRDSTPITNRQLESLIRLSEARARLELREEVTQRDAEEVVELMTECMYSSWEDNFGNFDARRSSGMSKKKLKDSFVALLTRQEQRLYTFAALKEIASSHGLLEQITDFRGFIEELNVMAYLTITKGSEGKTLYEFRG